MVTSIHTVAFEGVRTTDVEVQVHIAAGLPSFTIVGLPDKAVGESRERVRVAIQALGLALPAKRITINLSPADIAKEGSYFDLPIALGILAAMEIISSSDVANMLVMGELSLDGRLLPVSGVLPCAVSAAERDYGLICPAANASEAAWAGDVQILAPDSLIAYINHVKGKQLLSQPTINTHTSTSNHPDLASVKGHALAKRALEIAAVGRHNMLLKGPPGTGKSMLAACLPGIMPPLTSAQMLELSMIASISGALPHDGLLHERPFRAPHHSASLASMVGGGKRAKPGEISLAHHGVLFLDELPEFPRAVLESLRQPLETRNITISRANAHITYPADFQLIAAMNPCRCGYLGDAARSCSKAPRCGQDYQSKISGPLLDRFDIHIDMPMLQAHELFDESPAETSAIVRERITQAHATRAQRLAHHDNNMDDAYTLDDKAKATLQHAAIQLQLSMRGITRVTRVAHTIADLEQRSTLTNHCISEALSMRQIVGATR